MFDVFGTLELGGRYIVRGHGGVGGPVQCLHRVQGGGGRIDAYVCTNIGMHHA